MEHWNTASNLDEKLQEENNNVSNEKQVDEYKAKHDALYGKYSAKAEKELELSKKLFKANPEEIEGFSDSVKNKIIKEEYWYDTYEEAKAVLGETFYKVKDNTGDEDDLETRLSILEKEKKIAEYKAKKALLNNKIEVYLAKHPNLEDKKSLIINELEKISESIDIDERIETAVMLTKAKHWSNEDVNFATTTSWGSKNVKTTSDERVERNPDLARIFWNNIS